MNEEELKGKPLLRLFFLSNGKEELANLAFNAEYQSFRLANTVEVK